MAGWGVERLDGAGCDRVVVALDEFSFVADLEVCGGRVDGRDDQASGGEAFGYRPGVLRDDDVAAGDVTEEGDPAGGEGKPGVVGCVEVVVDVEAGGQPTQAGVVSCDEFGGVSGAVDGGIENRSAMVGPVQEHGVVGSKCFEIGVPVFADGALLPQTVDRFDVIGEPETVGW